MPKTARGITIDDDVWKEVKKQAEKENRPISNFVETVLKNYLAQKEKENPGK